MVALPKSHLLDVLKAGSGTPLDEASAALALLVEAGQYRDVIRYGNPLLKAATAAMPGPMPPSAKATQPPVPELEQLAADLALSVALAHVSLAAEQGTPAGSSAGAPLNNSELPSAPAMPISSQAVAGGSLEDLYGHLEAALQVLARHGVAEALQQEVAYCLQNVAVALAEELLKSTPPVAPPATAPPVGGSAAAGAASPDTAAAATALRTRAISLLRGALWKTTSTNNHHNHSSHNGHGHGHSASSQSEHSASSHGQREQQQPGGGATTAPGAAPTASGGVWPPELTAEERCELLAPLRGLLTASEHIALYGPVASAQKPYVPVRLSDQELYDLAVAHLAQGVTTGWPQHVLQALSYFERVSQQQQQQGGAAALAAAPAALGPAAADVSFERSVCEALLGRRSSAAGTEAAAAAAAAESHLSGASGASPPMKSMDFEEWDLEGADDAALLKRLEAHLAAAAAAAAGGGAGAAGEQQSQLRAGGEAVASFSVKESPNTSVESDEELHAPAQQAVALDAAPGTGVPPAPQGQPAKANKAGGAAAAKGADMSRRFGWAESWLELSVMPCFPETAGGGSGALSLARWFADPRVILFNKLLAVRSSEAQVTAALGSAVAHVSDASRQRLWQLWQAAANAVAGAAAVAVAAKGAHVAQPAGAGATVSKADAAVPAAPAAAAPAAAGNAPAGSGGGMSPLASGLLAQSRAALQDVAPRAAAAANAVAAAAAALGTAAASSPRAVAAAATNWMVRRGPAAAAASPGAVLVGSAAPDRVGRAATAATAAALPPKAAAAGAATSVEGTEGSATGSTAPPKSNNVVPFSAPASGGGGGAEGPSASPAAQIRLDSVGGASPAGPVAAPPSATGLVDVAAAPPPAGSGAPASAADGADAVGADGALWAPDAEGHLRPRMVARVVQDAAAAAAASIKERVAALPEWRIVELAAMDEAQAREAMRRVGAVAAQAVCLGALAAYVGHRIIASGALQAAAGGAAGGFGSGPVPGGGDRAPAAAVALDASSAQAAAAARAVGKWLRAVTAAPGGGAASPSTEAVTVESVSRLAALVGAEPRLGEDNAAALLRGWAAARAAAPGLSDPQDRVELLGGVLGGRALHRARAEADRDARLGRRVAVQRLEVEVEQLLQQHRSPAAAAEPNEVAVTAVVVTTGTQASRAAPAPEAFCSTERLAVTFRREPSGGGGGGGVWRLVDVRNAPPALF